MPTDLPRGFTSVTIAAGDHTSSADNLHGAKPTRLFVPPGTQGGMLLLLHGITEDGPFYPAYDALGGRAVVPFAAIDLAGGASVDFPSEPFARVDAYRIQTLQADGATPQTQGAARTFYLRTGP